MDIQVMARNSISKGLVENCLQFFRNELKLQNSRYSLIVVPQRGMSVRDGIRGSVFKLGPTVIGMNIDTALDTERLIIALAHEMIHVKQYARGQITHGKNLNSKFWMGKKFRGHYYDLPWEVEAFSKERVLANKVFKIIDKADVQLKLKKNGKK
jgi:hypothetical protein